MSPRFAALLLLINCLCALPEAAAELVFDDFDGNASLELSLGNPPDDDGRPSVAAGYVGQGDLSAERFLQAQFANASVLDGKIDIGTTTPSTWTSQFNEFDDILPGFLEAGVRYEFDESTDLTQDDKYDAIKVDVQAITFGPQADPNQFVSLLLSLNSEAGVFQLTHPRLSPTLTGQSLLFRFDQFTGREIPPGFADFTQANQLLVLYDTRRKVDGTDAGLTFTIDRISLVNTTVPEPATGAMALFALVGFIPNHGSRR